MIHSRPETATHPDRSMTRFKINYRDIAPSGDVIGRGIIIDADCLEDAEARACLLARGDEDIESVRRFTWGEVA
jgi:hypothetical protein